MINYKWNKYKWGKRIMRALIFLALLFVSSAQIMAAPETSEGKVLLVDLGSKNCSPCRMMAPDLKSLAKLYEGKAIIKVIDIIKNPEERKKYDSFAMPTQIFFDKKGRERYRHEGYMDKKEIRKIIDQLLAE